VEACGRTKMDRCPKLRPESPTNFAKPLSRWALLTSWIVSTMARAVVLIFITDSGTEEAVSSSENVLMSDLNASQSFILVTVSLDTQYFGEIS
jgi:hypothetical protein